MELIYDPNVIYAPTSSWGETFISADGRTIWNAHRPIPGTHTWEGKSRWGTWYATAELTDERYAYYAEQARALDAREIVAVTNADVLELAEQVREAKGSPYGLLQYISAMDTPAEAAAEYAASLGLPWATKGDTTADAKLKEYDA